LTFQPTIKNTSVDIAVSGHSIKWEMSARYLGVYLESCTKFKCSFSKKTKRDFKKSYNSIFVKIGLSASEEVLFELIKSKCLPILLYGTDVCPMNSADRHSLQFTINKIVYKIFGAMSKDLYIEISAQFGVDSVENLVANRRNRFIKRYGETDNYLCQMLH